MRIFNKNKQKDNPLENKLKKINSSLNEMGQIIGSIERKVKRVEEKIEVEAPL